MLKLWQVEQKAPDPIWNEGIFKMPLPSHYKGRMYLASLIKDLVHPDECCDAILREVRPSNDGLVLELEGSEIYRRNVSISEDQKTEVWDDDGSPWPALKPEKAFDIQVLKNLSYAHHIAENTLSFSVFVVGANAYGVMRRWLAHDLFDVECNMPLLKAGIFGYIRGRNVYCVPRLKDSFEIELHKPCSEGLKAYQVLTTDTFLGSAKAFNPTTPDLGYPYIGMGARGWPVVYLADGAKRGVG